MLQVGDFVKVHEYVWRKIFPKRVVGSPPSGKIIWISPDGVHRIMIENCGWQFKQDQVDLLWIDVDVSEF